MISYSRAFPASTKKSLKQGAHRVIKHHKPLDYAPLNLDSFEQTLILNLLELVPPLAYYFVGESSKNLSKHIKSISILDVYD
jgi:hypothetical protein